MRSGDAAKCGKRARRYPLRPKSQPRMRRRGIVGKRAARTWGRALTHRWSRPKADECGRPFEARKPLPGRSFCVARGAARPRPRHLGGVCSVICEGSSGSGSCHVCAGRGLGGDRGEAFSVIGDGAQSVALEPCRLPKGNFMTGGDARV